VSRGLDAKVAASVDAPASLLAHFPQLFAGFDALGSAPRRVVNLLARHGVGTRSRVIELASGKGALAVMLAERLGARVDAVEAFAPFVAEARERAREAGVARLVRFRQGDVSRVRLRARRGGGADVALMIGLFPLERAARTMRALVRPGGLYVIDDALRLPGAPPRFSHLHTARSARVLIESLGDEPVRVACLPARDVRRQNRLILARLTRNARSLRTEHPSLARALGEFLKRQRASSRVLEGPIRPALILARRGQEPRGR
jgi:SAM-dependent methyltransferase